jgi:transcriptional regulator with XRE-family HTH domain
MDVREIGRQLRARRAAAGRTVASVAMDAGLSVPYVANLENGRGNPTLSALSRLAVALDTRLAVSLDSVDQAADSEPRSQEGMPQSLVRFGRTRRFRAVCVTLSRGLGADPDQLAAQLLSGLAAVGAGVGRDLSEADCWRLIDAVTLIALSPAAGE